MTLHVQTTVPGLANVIAATRRKLDAEVADGSMRRLRHEVQLDLASFDDAEVRVAREAGAHFAVETVRIETPAAGIFVVRLFETVNVGMPVFRDGAACEEIDAYELRDAVDVTAPMCVPIHTLSVVGRFLRPATARVVFTGLAYEST